MVQNTDCSPYLLRKRRGLCEACRQIRAAHGRAVWPCAGCALADTCRREPLIDAPVARPLAALPALRGKLRSRA